MAEEDLEYGKQSHISKKYTSRLMRYEILKEHNWKMHVSVLHSNPVLKVPNNSDVKYLPNNPIANCMRPRAIALSLGSTHRKISSILPTSDVEWMKTNMEKRMMYQIKLSHSRSQYPIVAFPEGSFPICDMLALLLCMHTHSEYWTQQNEDKISR